MYDSLKNTSSGFHLFIFPFDDQSRDILIGLKLKNVTIIPLQDFETDELKEVKKSRTKAEYCWTCTPSIISYVLENFKVTDCTYIDSDLVFYSDPAILIDELDVFSKNVLITDHRFSLLPRLYEEKRAGRFCVQFMTFRNEESSKSVLEKWRSQCIEWCYAKHEDGKFGDQKYLDEWPDAYHNVHILKHHGGGLAPWNLQNYLFKKKEGDIYVTQKRSKMEYRLVFYHFQYVKTFTDGSFDIGWYLISPKVKKLLYLPYVNKIEEWENQLSELSVNYNRGFTAIKYGGIKSFLKNVMNYNILKIK